MISINFYKFLLISILSLLFLFPGTVLANHNNTSQVVIFGINLGCYPDHPPAQGGCSFAHAINFIDQLIERILIYVVIPLATLMLVWAGFVIITAGGNAHQYEKGKKMILAAVIGIVITLLAGAAVGIVYELVTGKNLQDVIRVP